MKDSALLEIFAALTPWELRSFKVWLESPWFNRKTTLLRLFDYLNACRNKDKVYQLDQAYLAVFEPPYPGIARLRHEMSDLLKLLREFLVWQELAQQPLQHNFFLLHALRKRGLEKNFALVLRETENYLADENMQGAFSGNLDQFRLEIEKHQWAMRSKRDPDFSFEKMANNLNAWYVGQLLQIACIEHSQQALLHREKRGVEWIEPLLREIPGRPQEQLPGVALYYYGYHMITDPDDSEPVRIFRDLLEQHQGRLLRDEARELLMLAINHGIRRINEGDKAALQPTLDFYLLGLEKGLLQDEKGVLTKYTYNNILMNFLALQEWGKAAQFLEQYRPQLPPKEQENTYRYNLAIYHFRRGDFGTTLELLRNVNFPDAMYNLEARKMLLKIYFEQGASDALESTLENLLTWLRRHGEIGYHREMYRNLARFTGQLLRLTPGDAEGRKRLGKKIRDTPLVAERTWLLEKLKSNR
ncbi:MAG: hypothetical protein HUU01_24240 [Saprospiraceae bacterium]|nr:hypothetical protein [Saprospiraceae bacterium]